MAESFMKTLKAEEVHGADYRDMDDARTRIGQFLEQVYNRQRLHSALRYQPPEEFEAAQTRNLSTDPVGRPPRPTATTTAVAH
jgi:putative transposase